MYSVVIFYTTENTYGILNEIFLNFIEFFVSIESEYFYIINSACFLSENIIIDLRNTLLFLFLVYKQFIGGRIIEQQCSYVGLVNHFFDPVGIKTEGVLK